MRSCKEHVEEDERRGLRGEPLESQHLRNELRKRNPQKILKRSLGTTKIVEGGPGGAFIRRMEPPHPKEVGLARGVCYRHADTYAFLK